LDRAPDATMEAIRDEVVGFQMPGEGMTDFARNSVIMAKAGIYDLRLHCDEVIQPVLRFWKIFERTDFGPRGEAAREQLAKFMVELDAQATRFVDRREASRARHEARASS
jgi:acyl-[acyl-carrier-protein] desaturase